jgi:peptidyl-tRNA hydrolase
MLTDSSPHPSEEDLKQVRTYVLVRRDVLPLVHCVCQVAHSVAEFVFYHQNNNTKVWITAEKTLIVLEATEDQIKEKMEWFAKQHMNYQPFYEPDMNNIITAVTFQPITKEIGKEIFGDLKLLK